MCMGASSPKFCEIAIAFPFFNNWDNQDLEGGKWFAQCYIWATPFCSDIVLSHEKKSAVNMEVLADAFLLFWLIMFILLTWIPREYSGYSEITAPWKPT